MPGKLNDASCAEIGICGFGNSAGFVDDEVVL